MGLVSIEEAVLGFVRKVKDDPESSKLLRDALHELEVVLDPQAAEQTTPPPPAAAPPPEVTEPPVDPTPAPPVEPGPVG